MTDEIELLFFRVVAFLNMSPNKKAAVIQSSKLFPDLPHDSGSRQVLDIESNALFCMAVDLDDYYFDAFIGSTDYDTSMDRVSRAMQAYMRILINYTFSILKSDGRLLDCWTKQGLSSDVWLGFSLLSQEIRQFDKEIELSLLSDGDLLFNSFVPDKGSLEF